MEFVSSARLTKKGSRLMIRSRIVGGIVTALALAAFAAMPGSSVAQAAEYPTKPVIFVAPGTLGGGSDVQARLAANVVTKAGIFGNEPAAVLNKGGGGSQEAFTFMLQHKGDPHYLLTFQASLITYTLLGEAQYKLEDFTPIANLVQDPAILVARADSGWKSLADLVKAAKEAPGEVLIAGGGVAGPDRMGLLTLQKAAGFETRYIPYAGGGEIHRAILGGEVKAAVGSPSDFMTSLESGDLVGLALMDTERGTVGPLKEIPTTVELGYPDAVFGTYRGWFTAGDVDPEIKKLLEDGFKKVVEDPEFKEKYIDRFAMRPNFMGSEEFAAHIKNRVEVFSAILKEAGVIK
jgi:putative tricarboxylic transport membrane protein